MIPETSKRPKLESESFATQEFMTPQGWHPNSWKEKSIHQDVLYPDPKALNQVKEKLVTLPPLVTSQEIDRLRSYLQEVAEGKRFLLQGGDCAELFEYCSQEPIENKLKVLLQMSLILTWGGRMKVVRVARMAGQYAKPRSKPTEMIDGVEYNSFRGDNVNGMPLQDRTPDPSRLLSAYFHSAATLNYVRAMLSSNFADLHNPNSWNLKSEKWRFAHVRNEGTKKEYQAIVDRLLDALDFMQVIGADQDASSSAATRSVDMFMSHEGLLLDYESDLTRKYDQGYYNVGTHFLWIGDRTRQLNGAHIEYFRGIRNPIGVKVGPSMKPEELGPLLDILNPNKEVGKVTLITRYGADKIKQYLSAHISAVQKSGHIVVWCCDPMHGNTETVNGIKTRRFENIVSEISSCFDIHKQHGSYLGGVHFELTGDPVTETMGGSMNLDESDLSKNYQTFCDPRLNYEQSLDVAFLIAKKFQK